MKKNISLILLVVLSACTKKDQFKECETIAKDFDSATRGYLIGCLKSCLNTTIAHSKNPSDKEKFKETCESLCRDSIPYEQINLIKKAIDDVHRCDFNYEKKLGNATKK